jgi:uncharacterized iron-regulated protein
MFSRIRTTVAPVLSIALLSACTGGRVAPVTAPTPASSSALRIVSGTTAKDVSFATMVEEALHADVIFFGETHDDDGTHRAEFALLSAIGERHGKVVLSLEMFERDVQPVLDDYLAGRIDEAAFRERSRPWPNYASDYRPLVELAKSKGWPVIAANVPRPLASMVSHVGLAAVDTLTGGRRALVAADLQCPKDKYYQNFVEVMGGGHGGGPQPTAAAASPMQSMTDLFYQAQCIKDETMAESIVQARAKAGGSVIVVHFTGSFHTDFGLGTASRVRRRLPDAKTVVISAVPVPAPTAVRAAEFTDRGQFIIFPVRKAP